MKLTKPVKKELAAILHETLAAHLGDLTLYHYRKAYDLRDKGAVKLKGKRILVNMKKMGKAKK